MSFDPRDVVPNDLYARLVQCRVDRPELAEFSADRRRRRAKLTVDGRLHIVAADHPARGVISVGNKPTEMANRREYLARIIRALRAPGVDGVMATMDILEELLILDQLCAEKSTPTFLDNKVLVASLNRGGIQGSAWELNDPVTGTTPEICARYGIEGAKLLLRIHWDDRDSLETIKACADAITACHAHNLTVFLEPLPIIGNQQNMVLDRSPDSLSRIVGIASALGGTSARLWLKLPICADFHQVARATSLPIVLLGGEASGDLLGTLAELEQGLAAGPNVRGAMMGRNLLFPEAGDPFHSAGAMGRVIHEGLTAPEAMKSVQDHQAHQNTQA